MDLCRHPDFFFLSISSFSILVYFKGTLYFLKPDLDFFSFFERIYKGKGKKIWKIASNFVENNLVLY